MLHGILDLHRACHKKTLGDLFVRAHTSELHEELSVLAKVGLHLHEFSDEPHLLLHHIDLEQAIVGFLIKYKF